MYTLQNIAAVHVKHPDTFQIPSVKDRRDIKPGDYVKVIFVPEGWAAEGTGCEGERMWLQVIGQIDDKYVGRLDNDPVLFEGKLLINDKIEFGIENICSIEKGGH